MSYATKVLYFSLFAFKTIWAFSYVIDLFVILVVNSSIPYRNSLMSLSLVLSDLYTSLTSSFPSVEHSCKCGKEVVESAKVESAKAALSKLEETVTDVVTTKPHRGRKSNAEKKLATESTQESSSAEKLGGGSVFKDFVPLETSSVMSPHSQAYLPPEKKASSNVLTVL